MYMGQKNKNLFTEARRVSPLKILLMTFKCVLKFDHGLKWSTF